jgi:hypothetical protein
MVKRFEGEYLLSYSTLCEEKSVHLSPQELLESADFIVEQDVHEEWFELGKLMFGPCTYFAWWKDTKQYLVFSGDEESVLGRLKKLNTMLEEEMGD